MSRKTFELNGKAYDALTGAMLGDARRASNAVPASGGNGVVIQAGLQPASRSRGVSMDGMVGTAKPQLSLAAGSSQRQAQHLSPRQPQPSKTLVRRSVKIPDMAAPAKPAATTTTAGLQVQAGLAPQPATPPQLRTKLGSGIVDPRRALRARNASRSQAVQRFAVTPAPVRRTAPTPMVAALAPAAMPVAPAYTPPGSSAYDEADNYEDDLFSQALAQATSHQEPVPEGVKSRRSLKRRAQVFGIIGSIAVFVLLVGFIVFQNRNDLRMQLASAKAGFSAAAPLYTPDGYALQDLKYATGTVASLYQRAQNQNFTITQKKSNWDSQTLLENFVATSNQDYEGFQSNGRTVYVYGGTNATWVNGGIWYEIKANGGLTSDQLVKIATSM